MASLKDKVALITGASSGIGQGTAIHMASLGCKLTISGRKMDNLQKTAQMCEEQGLAKEKIQIVGGGVTDNATMRELVEKTIDYFGQLDVLVNCAGIVIYDTCESIKMEDYDNLMNINCRSVVYLSNLAIPNLIKTKGCIVNVSSVGGLRSFPQVTSYCMSKAALDQYTRCAALELAPKQVRVNAVNPGLIVTEIHRSAGMSEEQFSQLLHDTKSSHALGRPGTVDEVAKCISFLASDDSSFITGATLSVDGGKNVMCPR
ncbi:uncharacterized protein LOC106151857 [Lingula anatina]|uniref:Uncharacterized protein LOC106151857 n=1 Tax=Lingula anatina TaxID=7574 RepID=A0A1S3H451_LINAN|nr:uncharacterized protein LOC106151857 [Lingula anatina]|eukprot:XP_013380737.1 uncharacterized protein LOC106151857 [Lingula anatina]